MVPVDDFDGWCERLYEAEAARLLLYGRALGLSHAEAEDVLHDTFQALLRRSARPDEPRAYLIRSYRNCALNHRRSLWRRLVRELEAGRWFERSAAESPRESLAMRVLATLPRDQREVIVLKIWHALTFDQIGRLLEASPNTIAGRYRYGLRKIRVAVEGVDYDELESQPFTLLEATPTLPGA